MEVGGVREDNNVCICELCGSFENLMLCAGCHSTWYCCKEHQRSDWKKHKATCRQKKGRLKQASVSQIQSQRDSPTVHLNNNEQSDAMLSVDSAFSQSFEVSEMVRCLPGSFGSRKSKVEDIARSQEEVVTVRHSATDPLGFTVQPGQSASGLEKAKPLSEYVVRCLNDYGICVVDNFLGATKGFDTLVDVKALHQSGTLKQGQLVYPKDIGKKVRGDIITWVEKGDPGCDNISYLIQKIDSLVMNCSDHFNKYSINGRTKAMVACYPGSGTGYMRHVDNPNGDGRCVTCIYYLNKDWDVKTHGGLLRIFPQRFTRVADIEPKFDRLLFFWSNRQNPHEVQPAYKTRYAITVWFFDAEERARAKQRFMRQDGEEGMKHKVSTELERKL